MHAYFKLRDRTLGNCRVFFLEMRCTVLQLKTSSSDFPEEAEIREQLASVELACASDQVESNTSKATHSMKGTIPSVLVIFFFF